MKLRWSILSLFVLVALVLSACGASTPTPAPSMGSDGPEAMPAASATPMSGASGSEMQNDAGTAMPADSTGAMQDDSNHAMPADTGTAMPSGSDGTMHDESGTPMPNTGSGAMDGEAPMALPAWFSAELTDVNTDQAFTIAGLQGKVILIETMAVWCSNCLQQQKQVKALHEAMGMNEDLVTVVLDIDPNENAADLSAYTARNGFDWTYAVAPRDVAREIGQLYGDQFLNPPSTPMLIVDRHGEAHPLPFGIKDAGTLQDALAPFLGGGM